MSEENPEKAMENMTSVQSSGNAGEFRAVYEDMQSFLRNISEEYSSFPEVLSMIAAGPPTIRANKRFILKDIDETWVLAIEKSLMSLDNLIRRPSRFIQESEEVMPIELARNISERSIRHLAQHTDYIIEYDEEKGTITPAKILNIFRDETILTYENKFVNTLINRLQHFVSKRYYTMLEKGMDEKCTSVNISSDFTSGKAKGKISLSIEFSEPLEAGTTEKSHAFSSDLWKRIKRIHSIVSDYSNSEFCKEMGQNYVRPPILRTNAINMNKDLKQCLALWEFIESYEKVGYEMLIEETAETIDSDYIQELCSMLAIQYMIFRYKVINDIDLSKALAHNETEDLLSPKFETELDIYSSDDYNVYDSQYHKVVPVSQTGSRKKLSDDELKMRRAVEIALEAEKIIIQRRLEEEERRRREEEERLRLEEEERRRLEEEERLRLEEEERLRREEEERLRLEEEERRRLEEEERLRLEEEERLRLEEEERRRLEEEERLRLEEEERLRLEEEERLRREEEERLRREEEERLRREEEERRRREEEERIRAERERLRRMGRKRKKQYKKKLDLKNQNQELNNKPKKA